MAEGTQLGFSAKEINPKKEEERCRLTFKISLKEKEKFIKAISKCELAILETPSFKVDIMFGD